MLSSDDGVQCCAGRSSTSPALIPSSEIIMAVVVVVNGCVASFCMVEGIGLLDDDDEAEEC